ncbi:hypothetical protein JK182_09390 [Acetobacter okinawensis]|uniref:hypothetical protein n=1 Tax=Acetobacter okinawensis TaxID=1076594 RepID=UPI001BABF1EB|nr:hypothetical protein [Acetobacter okinawensis]MBS0988873.1 hypothetical protein [Acetobacter okinawensis]
MCSAESHDYSRTITHLMESRMPTSFSRLRTILAVTCLPVLAYLLGMGIGASHPLTALLIGLGAASAAWVCTHNTPQPATVALPASPTAPAADSDQKLRHDIRGIVSPAMLAAEQLSLHNDPAIEKAAATINDSLDRLTARLKQRKAG